MTSTIKDIITYHFPHPCLELTITDTPTYHSIKKMHTQLNDNAASVPSNLNDGTLGLILSESAYKDIFVGNASITRPTKPTAHNITNDATTSNVATSQDKWKHKHNAWTECNVTDAALKEQLFRLSRTFILGQ